MRSLVFICVILSMGQPAIAQCGPALKAETRVIAECDQIAPATNFTLEQIAVLAKRSGARDSAPRNFCTARVNEHIPVNLDGEAGGGRNVRIMIEPRPRLAKRRIEIGREIVTRSCLYDAVLENYRAKAVADDTAVAARPRQSTFALPAARADATLDDTTRIEIEHHVKSVVDRARPPFHDARIAVQHAVDTPDELRRLALACGPNA